MNTTTAPPSSRFRSLAAEIFGPVDAPDDAVEHRLLVARSAVAYAGLVATLVQVVVWLMIALVTTHLDSPWWLWTTVPAAAAVGVLTAVVHQRRWWQRTTSREEDR